MKAAGTGGGCVDVGNYGAGGRQVTVVCVGRGGVYMSVCGWGARQGGLWCR